MNVSGAVAAIQSHRFHQLLVCFLAVFTFVPVSSHSGLTSQCVITLGSYFTVCHLTLIPPCSRTSSLHLTLWSSPTTRVQHNLCHCCVLARPMPLVPCPLHTSFSFLSLPLISRSLFLLASRILYFIFLSLQARALQKHAIDASHFAHRPKSQVTRTHTPPSSAPEHASHSSGSLREPLINGGFQ